MDAYEPLELIDAKSGRVSVRSGVTIALFVDRFVFECSEALTAALDLVIETFPPGALKWAVVSATSEQWKALDAASLRRMRESLAPAGARKRKITGFRINDAGGEAPQYGFRILDKDKDPAYPDSRTWIQVTFPLSWLHDDRIDRLRGVVESLTTLLKPDYGYCSPSLLTSDAGQPAAFAQLKGPAMRYPGYDVDMNVMSCLTIGRRVRGARWISLLGPALWSALAGSGATIAAAPADIEARDVAGTTWLQAGTRPELGDLNRAAKTPRLRSLAQFLQPVTLFGEIDLLSYFAAFDEDFLRRWERRFLDQIP